jgi:hypothetical protein
VRCVTAHLNIEPDRPRDVFGFVVSASLAYGDSRDVLGQ